MAPMRVLFCFLLVALSIVSLKGGNYTDKYVTVDREFRNRHQRLFTFDADTNGDIKVEMSFNVPFLTIPVKKSLNMAKGAIANINLGAIILAGAMVFVSAGLLPAAFFFLSKKMQTFGGPSYREDSDSDWYRAFSLLDETFLQKDLNTTSCLQKFLCWTVKTSSSKMASGNATSRDKIVDGIATNEWLNKLADGTIVHSAIQNGLNSANCTREYPTCKIHQRTMKLMLNEFVNSLNQIL